MMLHVIISILCLFYVPTINAAAPGKKQTEEAFLSKFNFDATSCRPGLIAGENGKPMKNPNLLMNTFEGSIACMLKGDKQVYAYSGTLAELLADSQELQNILAEKKFSYFELSKANFILFTPAGREKAFLLAKTKSKQTSLNDGGYSYGYLLGYLHKDIKAFYIKTINSESAADAFRAKTLKWIEQEIATIEEWAAQHLRIHTFEKNQTDMKIMAADQKSRVVKEKKVSSGDEIRSLIFTHTLGLNDCRPTINADNVKVVPDSLKDRVGCLIFKKQKIWFGDANALSFIQELSDEAQKKLYSKLKIIKLRDLDILSKPAKILVYTEYKDEAELLQRYFEEINRSYKMAKIRLELLHIKFEVGLRTIIPLVPTFYRDTMQKMSKEELVKFVNKSDKDLYLINHYLVGHLLGYQEEDIRVFYNKISSKEFPLSTAFEEHKKEAQRWLAENRNEIKPTTALSGQVVVASKK